MLLDKNLEKHKSPSTKAKGPEMVRLPRRNEFRNFCMSGETEAVYHKLEEVFEICLEFK